MNMGRFIIFTAVRSLKFSSITFHVTLGNASCILGFETFQLQSLSKLDISEANSVLIVVSVTLKFI